MGNGALAQELTNPVADIMTIPTPMEFDQNLGLNDEANRTTITIQPVVPVELNDDWNLITRIIVSERFCAVRNHPYLEIRVVVCAT